MPTVTTQQAFALGLQHHQAGRLADAEALYRQILAVQPNHADALQFLGVIGHQVGRYGLAVELIRQAIALNPNNFTAHFNLGEAYRKMDRFDEAIASFRRALQLQPDSVETLNAVGVALVGQGRFGEAVEAYLRAVALRPDSPEAHYNLGTAMARRGQLDEAIAAYHRALQLQPNYEIAHFNLGNAFRERHQFDEAVAVYRRVLQLNPDYLEAYLNLGNVLQDQGELDEAANAYRRALQLKPDFPEGHLNLGNVLKDQRRLDAAVAAYRRVLELKPDSPAAHYNLGTVLVEQGQLDEGIAAYRRALQLNPNQAAVHSSLVQALNLHPSLGDEAIAEEQRLWTQQFGEPIRRFVPLWANDRDPERPLRIGYIAPSFRDHVLARNVVPLFHHHDSGQFEILCYSGVVKPDKLTEEFRRRAGQWRNTDGVGDEALAEMIRQDGVDILVDLTQHMAGNRLPMLARRPAPVQVSFAGYPETTGLAAIGYRISDRYLEGNANGISDVTPVRSLQSNIPHPTSHVAAEQVLLIDSFWCYDPCGLEVAVKGLPALESGHVTFGSLNHFWKVNEPVLRLWARVLGKVKDSRLILLSPVGSHRQRALDVLEREGVAADRVEFAEPRPRRAYLELYHRLDICLDPYPCNGHSTSLDALWMGVPVVSQVGRRAFSRAGLSQISNLGLHELLAFSEDDYTGIATQLAHDLPRLAELRATLRSRMQASLLMDAARFARNIEAAYRTMWRAWCAEKQS